MFPSFINIILGKTVVHDEVGEIRNNPHFSYFDGLFCSVPKVSKISQARWDVSINYSKKLWNINHFILDLTKIQIQWIINVCLKLFKGLKPILNIFYLFLFDTLTACFALLKEFWMYTNCFISLCRLR